MARLRSRGRHRVGRRCHRIRGRRLIGAVGAVRFGSFFERLHAPTLATSFGAVGILLGSMICFSVLQSRPVLHEILVFAFITVTTPVTLMLLARAALFRRRAEGDTAVPSRAVMRGRVTDAGRQ